ncbi:hypothetical protein RGUI_2746 [Rhodovulum sp. P5]|uniref:hypothetical protein n=1 Tax=Rhodovulum sp. P5 TaxID=1564506 RepID=UPI0009C31433|nr:hypothetical protein [Rhodovulum sp. P5]ARE40887.1 hypothetical protein RGUI_2746 [Rhodovulum sp. P5]
MGERFTFLQMLALSGSAVRKVATRGRHGTTQVTLDEIEALVCLVVAYAMEEATRPGPGEKI